MSNRVRKTAVIALLLAVPLAFLAVSVRGFVVRNAVVTAELGIARAPIDGEVTESTLGAGQALQGAAARILLRNPRSDPRSLDALVAEIADVLREIENHRSDLSWHDATIAESEARLQAILSGMKLDLQMQHEIVLSDIAALKARLALAEAQYERVQRLQGTAASQANLDAALAQLDETRAKIASLQLTAEQIEQRRDFLDHSIPLVDFAGLAVTLADRIADMRIERQGVARETATLESRLVKLQDRLDSEQETYDRLASFERALPAGSAVWEIFAPPGAAVTAGAPLFSYIDCDQRLAEVAVEDSTVALIQAGHQAMVRIYGSDETIAGTVVAIYGSAAEAEERATLAANIAELDHGDAIALIAIEPADEASRRFRLCDVGRTAYVSFEGIGFLDPLINRLF